MQPKALQHCHKIENFKTKSASWVVCKWGYRREERKIRNNRQRMKGESMEKIKRRKGRGCNKIRREMEVLLQREQTRKEAERREKKRKKEMEE
jgi:hypothetical protein